VLQGLGVAASLPVQLPQQNLVVDVLRLSDEAGLNGPDRPIVLGFLAIEHAESKENQDVSALGDVVELLDEADRPLIGLDRTIDPAELRLALGFDSRTGNVSGVKEYRLMKSSTRLVTASCWPWE